MRASVSGSPLCGGVVRVLPQSGDIVAVCLEGEFDLANAPVLDEQIQRALEGGHNLIVDLSEATFIDSTVIHVLLRASKAARRREQALILQLSTAAIVERVMQIAGIDQILPRAHDRQEALRLIRQSDAM